MKKIMLIPILITWMLFLNLSATIADNGRIALIIGNSDYKSSPLKNPVNDAYDFAKVLRRCDFDVTLKLDATNREMKLAVRDFGKSLKRMKVGLFFYAGHGMQLNGRNYLIPVGSTIESEADVEFEALDAGLVLGKMNDADNDLNIVILDACRDNPFARSFRSSSRGLARINAPTGTIIAYATGPGSVAADGSGRNSPFTRHLIKNVRKPNLTIERILKNVRISVASDTMNRQVPWESSSLMGDFYFTRTPPPAAKPKIIPVFDEQLKAEQERQAKQKAALEKQKREEELRKAEQEKKAKQEQARKKQKQERALLKAEQERLAREKKEQERLAREKKELEQQRAQLEQLRIEQERIEQERIDQERINQERIKRERIEKERQARKKAEQEKKQQELEKQRAASENKNLAMLSPSVDPIKPAASDGRFEKDATGIVADKLNDLEWRQGDNLELSWDEAKTWLKQLQNDDERWRFPTPDELSTLYAENKGTRNMTPLLNPKSWWVWCKRGSTFFGGADIFDFYKGRLIGKYPGMRQTKSKYNSVMAVRGKNKKLKNKNSNQSER